MLMPIDELMFCRKGVAFEAASLVASATSSAFFSAKDLKLPVMLLDSDSKQN